jgi:CAAX protease family protein
VARERTGLDVALFVVVTAAISAPFWWLTVTHRGAPAASEYVIGLMWAPAAAAILLRRDVDLGLGVRPPNRHLLFGLVVPVAYITVTYVVGWAAGIIGLFGSDSIDAFAQLYKLADLDHASVTAFGIVWTLTVLILENALYALGEELGWRGYLVPVLSRRLGLLSTGIVSGLIWAAWHFPLMGRATVPQHALFAVSVVAIGIVCAWLRLRSRSVWPAVALHASHNAWLGFAGWMVDDPRSWYVDETGVGLAVATTAIAVVVVIRDRLSATCPRSRRSCCTSKAGVSRSRGPRRGRAPRPRWPRSRRSEPRHSRSAVGSPRRRARRREPFATASRTARAWRT